MGSCAHLDDLGGLDAAEELVADQEAAHVALDGDRRAVHHHCAQLVKLRHLARPQEHLRLAQLVPLRQTPSPAQLLRIQASDELLAPPILWSLGFRVKPAQKEPAPSLHSSTRATAPRAKATGSSRSTPLSRIGKCANVKSAARAAP